MNLPDPLKQVITLGVKEAFTESNHLGDLWAEVITQYKKQPNVCIDGGNDKEFFSFTFYGMKLFVVANEIGGLTVMLPEEY